MHHLTLKTQNYNISKIWSQLFDTRLQTLFCLIILHLIFTPKSISAAFSSLLLWTHISFNQYVTVLSCAICGIHFRSSFLCIALATRFYSKAPALNLSRSLTMCIQQVLLTKTYQVAVTTVHNIQYNLTSFAFYAVSFIVSFEMISSCRMSVLGSLIFSKWDQS